MAIICTVHRRRIIPLYTGLKSLWIGGDRAALVGSIDYQRVSAFEKQHALGNSGFGSGGSGGGDSGGAFDDEFDDDDIGSHNSFSL